MTKFKVANINCQNCVNTIKNALCDEFGDIQIDLSANPRIVSVDLKDTDIENFKNDLEELGFSVIEQI